MKPNFGTVAHFDRAENQSRDELVADGGSGSLYGSGRRGTPADAEGIRRGSRGSITVLAGAALE